MPSLCCHQMRVVQLDREVGSLGAELEQLPALQEQCEGLQEEVGDRVRTILIPNSSRPGLPRSRFTHSPTGSNRMLPSKENIKGRGGGVVNLL